jgi:ABC-2 type transport system ATP-binding protein
MKSIDGRAKVSPALTGDAALEVSNVSFAYGAKKVLRDVSFTVPRGRITFLLGPNGAGKTTLFSLITRLFDPTEGRISILGRDVRNTGHKALAPLGVVFQQPTLDLDLTVRQNLAYYGALRGLGRAEIRERTSRCLAELDMAERIDEVVRTLNGGHRRRVEIARALLHRPTLLILDEPTVGLDPDTRQAIVRRMHELARTEGAAMLWASHLVDEPETNDGLLVLSSGRLVASGPVGKVVEQEGAVDLAEAYTRLVRRSGSP